MKHAGENGAENPDKVGINCDRAAMARSLHAGWEPEACPPAQNDYKTLDVDGDGAITLAESLEGESPPARPAPAPRPAT